MKYPIITFFLLLVTASMFAQNKRDYIWPMGKDSNLEIEGAQGYRFDFHTNPVGIYKSTNALEMSSNNATICSSEGELLFYSNGCGIFNADDEYMLNGDSINAGDFFDQFLDGSCEHGYTGVQDVIILTDPGDPNGYYLIHKPISLSDPNNPPILEMRYSYVDMEGDAGMGEVLDKNSTFYEAEPLMLYYLTAIQHANQKDWWILQPKKDTNLILTFLLDETGIQRMDDQVLEGVFPNFSNASGTAKFSPDGSRYAIYSFYDQLRVFDFDRSSGLLSNEMKVKILDPDPNPNNIYFCSVEWSPNSEFVYIASVLTLHQVEVNASPIESGIELIDEYNGAQNPFPSIFFLMAQGPDCRIYMCGTSSSRTYHVINKPDLKGVACDFVQNGVDVPEPYTSTVASMPNHPRWRVDEEQKCDPSIVSMFGSPIVTNIDLKLHPNPSSDFVNIELPERLNGTLGVVDEMGRRVFEQNYDQVSAIRLNVSDYFSGIYLVEFSVEEGDRVYVGKLQVLR